MSKYKKVTTKFHSRGHLKTALEACGLPFEEAQIGQQIAMVGYDKSDQRTADFVIRKANISSYGDMGYKWNGIDAFDLVADDYHGQKLQEQTIKLVNREYAAVFTISQVEMAGHTWERVDQENGAVKIYVNGRI